MLVYSFVRIKENGGEKNNNLRVGADELDVRQLDPRQSVCPPVPDRKQKTENSSLFLIQMQRTSKPNLGLKNHRYSEAMHVERE